MGHGECKTMGTSCTAYKCRGVMLVGAQALLGPPPARPGHLPCAAAFGRRSRAPRWGRPCAAGAAPAPGGGRRPTQEPGRCFQRAAGRAKATPGGAAEVSGGQAVMSPGRQAGCSAQASQISGVHCCQHGAANGRGLQGAALQEGAALTCASGAMPPVMWLVCTPRPTRPSSRGTVASQAGDCRSRASGVSPAEGEWPHKTRTHACAHSRLPNQLCNWQGTCNRTYSVYLHHTQKTYTIHNTCFLTDMHSNRRTNLLLGTSVPMPANHGRMSVSLLQAAGRGPFAAPPPAASCIIANCLRR
jgi:hypothetical protein